MKLLDFANENVGRRTDQGGAQAADQAIQFVLTIDVLLFGLLIGIAQNRSQIAGECNAHQCDPQRYHVKDSTGFLQKYSTEYADEHRHT